MKIEHVRENVFMFKFRDDVDKMRGLFDGLYHFNVALIILTNLGGIGDASKYSFIYTLF